MWTINALDMLPPWLTNDLSKLAASWVKLKTFTIKEESSILMNSYKQVQKNVNNLGRKPKEDYITNKSAPLQVALLILKPPLHCSGLAGRRLINWLLDKDALWYVNL